MELHRLKVPRGAKRKAQRKGRGHASTLGKTSGRGQKGQHARNTVAPGFEGGQTPLRRRLPRRGFNNHLFRNSYWLVNLRSLENSQLADKKEIHPQDLQQVRVIRNLQRPLKILGMGSLKRPLKIYAHRFSSAALEKIKAAGGEGIVIEAKDRPADAAKKKFTKKPKNNRTQSTAKQ